MGRSFKEQDPPLLGEKDDSGGVFLFLKIYL